MSRGRTRGPTEKELEKEVPNSEKELTAVERIKL